MKNNKESIKKNSTDTSTTEDKLIRQLKTEKDTKDIPLNEKITFFRLNTGLSKSQLARAIDVSPAYITLIEKGTNTPSVPLLNKMARVFGISTDELAGKRIFSLKEIKDENDAQILIPFNKLNSDGQKKAIEYLTDLGKIYEYTEKITDFQNVIKEANESIKTYYQNNLESLSKTILSINMKDNENDTKEKEE